MKKFTTKDPETGEDTTMVVKTDEDGHVSDALIGVEADTSTEKNHGHVWNLNEDVSDNGDDPIGGRDPKLPGGTEKYPPAEEE